MLQSQSRHVSRSPSEALADFSLFQIFAAAHAIADSIFESSPDVLIDASHQERPSHLTRAGRSFAPDQLFAFVTAGEKRRVSILKVFWLDHIVRKSWQRATRDQRRV